MEIPFVQVELSAALDSLAEKFPHGCGALVIGGSGATGSTLIDALRASKSGFVNGDRCITQGVSTAREGFLRLNVASLAEAEWEKIFSKLNPERIFLLAADTNTKAAMALTIVGSYVQQNWPLVQIPTDPITVVNYEAIKSFALAFQKTYLGQAVLNIPEIIYAQTTMSSYCFESVQNTYITSKWKGEAALFLFIFANSNLDREYIRIVRFGYPYRPDIGLEVGGGKPSTLHFWIGQVISTVDDFLAGKEIKRLRVCSDDAIDPTSLEDIIKGFFGEGEFNEVRWLTTEQVVRLISHIYLKFINKNIDIDKLIESVSLDDLETVVSVCLGYRDKDLLAWFKSSLVGEHPNAYNLWVDSLARSIENSYKLRYEEVILTLLGLKVNYGKTYPNLMFTPENTRIIFGKEVEMLPALVADISKIIRIIKKI